MLEIVGFIIIIFFLPNHPYPFLKLSYTATIQEIENSFNYLLNKSGEFKLKYT